MRSVKTAAYDQNNNIQWYFLAICFHLFWLISKPGNRVITIIPSAIICNSFTQVSCPSYGIFEVFSISDWSFGLLVSVRKLFFWHRFSGIGVKNVTASYVQHCSLLMFIYSLGEPQQGLWFQTFHRVLQKITVPSLKELPRNGQYHGYRSLTMKGLAFTRLP